MILIDFLIDSKDYSLYLSIVTEITIILNNIFYTSSKTYKDFWRTNANFLYFNIVYPLLNYNQNEIRQYENKNIETDDYYHLFFQKICDETIKQGLVFELEEFSL